MYMHNTKEYQYRSLQAGKEGKVDISSEVSAIRWNNLYIHEVGWSFSFLLYKNFPVITSFD